MQTYLTSSKRYSDLADDVLVQRAHIGDHGAFELLVDRYSAVLLRLIYHLVRDEHLAHDILQYVFLQLYRSLPTLRAQGTLKAWLSQVARNRCFDELRRKRPVYFSEVAPDSDGDEFSPLLMLPDPDLPLEEQVEQDELRELLLEAIETLPSSYRAVVLLRYTHQLSFREIGQELGIPDSTAKTYFHRARKPLRALLEPEFADYRDTEKQSVEPHG
jgi:RNA polymerase sigma-70 factor (ECF subfamily)